MADVRDLPHHGDRDLASALCWLNKAPSPELPSFRTLDVRYDDFAVGDEEAALAIWLAASPAHVEAWRHARKVWGEVGQSEDPLLASIRQSALTMRRRPDWRAHAAWTTGAVAAAAGILAMVGIGQWNVWPAGNPAPQNGLVRQFVYATDRDRSDIVMPDGTKVALDAGTRLVAIVDAHRRDVRLEAGQAFFTVAHDGKRPFAVTAQGHVVTDVGTAFAVSVQPGALSVTLVQGKVRIADAGRQAVDLDPGEAYHVGDGGVPTIARVDVQAALSWRSGFLTLDNERIADALAVMNRHAARQVAIEDVAAGNLRVTGRFPIDDPEQFARTVAAIHPVRIRSGAGGELTIASRWSLRTSG